MSCFSAPPWTRNAALPTDAGVPGSNNTSEDSCRRFEAGRDWNAAKLFGPDGNSRSDKRKRVVCEKGEKMKIHFSSRTLALESWGRACSRGYFFRIELFQVVWTEKEREREVKNETRRVGEEIFEIFLNSF